VWTLGPGDRPGRERLKRGKKKKPNHKEGEGRQGDTVRRWNKATELVRRGKQHRRAGRWGTWLGREKKTRVLGGYSNWKNDKGGVLEFDSS